MPLTPMEDTRAARTMNGTGQHEGVETIFSAVYRPICCLAGDVTNGGGCVGDGSLLALDDELSDIHDVPFDEFASDKVSSSGSSTRKGIDPNMMMLSQLSECGSLVQPQLDDESLSGDGWTDYSDTVSDMYTSMLGEMDCKDE